MNTASSSTIWDGGGRQAAVLAPAFRAAHAAFAPTDATTSVEGAGCDEGRAMVSNAFIIFAAASVRESSRTVQ